MRCEWIYPDHWWDRNFDGVFSLTDIWLIAKWVFHWPGDLFVQWAIDNWPTATTFLELDCSSLGGSVSTAISVATWFAAFLLFAFIAAASE